MPAEVAIPCTALVQRFGQGQEGRVPLGQAVLTQAGVAGVVAVAIEKTGLDAGGSGIAMDVAERIQSADVIVPGEPGTMIAPLPEVSRAPEQAVETPGTVPVEPMHEARQIGRLCGFQEIVDVIAHETQSVQLESELLDCLGKRVEKQVAAERLRQMKLSIVTTRGDMVTGLWHQFAVWA